MVDYSFIMFFLRILLCYFVARFFYVFRFLQQKKLKTTKVNFFKSKFLNTKKKCGILFDRDSKFEIVVSWIGYYAGLLHLENARSTLRGLLFASTSNTKLCWA